MSDGIVRVCVVGDRPTLDRAALIAAATVVRRPRISDRVVLMSHPGPNFCLGADVRAFAAAPDLPGFVHDVAEELHALVRALIASPLPVVAGVQGWAAGAGMSLACVADVVVAGPSTRFRAAYPGLGVSPDGGLSWTLPRAVGRARALDLLLTNRAVGVENAVAYGLVSRVVADEAIEATAATVAADLAAAAPLAMAATRRLVHDGLTRDLDDQLDAETTSISRLAATADAREGIRAFGAHEQPRFRGDDGSAVG